MKTLKVMSVIGIVFAVLSLFCMIAFQPDSSLCDSSAMLGWGFYISAYAIALSIIGLVMANKYKQDFSEKLILLNELKEKGIITIEEFETSKKKILKK